METFFSKRRLGAGWRDQHHRQGCGSKNCFSELDSFLRFWLIGHGIQYGQTHRLQCPALSQSVWTTGAGCQPMHNHGVNKVNFNDPGRALRAQITWQC
jgi:hypothetical protein